MEHWDPALAAIGGVVLSVLGVLDLVSTRALIQWTIALLSLLAFSLIRERIARTDQAIRTRSAVREAAATVKDSVQALDSVHPYRVLSTHHHWDLQAEDGSLAYARKVKRLRFNQSKVATIADFSQGDGETANAECRGGPDGGAYLPKLTDAGTCREADRHFQLWNLGRFWNKDEAFVLKLERELRDSFKSDSEEVGVYVLEPSDLVQLEVTWPAGRPPKSLRRTRRMAGANQASDDVDLFANLETLEGRRRIDIDVRDAMQGELITLAWHW
jgi:hypothetical protein